MSIVMKKALAEKEQREISNLKAQQRKERKELCEKKMESMIDTVPWDQLALKDRHSETRQYRLRRGQRGDYEYPCIQKESEERWRDDWQWIIRWYTDGDKFSLKKWQGRYSSDRYENYDSVIDWFNAILGLIIPNLTDESLELLIGLEVEL